MKAGNSNQHTPLVFVSYAREDNLPRGNEPGWLDWFCCHLKPSLDYAGIDLFIDNTIITGEYTPPIRQALDRATAGILLLSHHFMNSQYIMEKELPILIARYKAKQLDLFPVLLTYCSWNRLPVPYPQPHNGKQAHFLLSKLVLAEHDPDHPLDSLSGGRVNKVFDETTHRIIRYHEQRKKMEEELLKGATIVPGTPAPERTTIVDNPPPDNTTIIPDTKSIKDETIVIQKPAWASDAGKDQYGEWAEFTINGITQRMRWIEPGEFLMGSPEDEPGRNDDEYQHRVVITKGFWLADTACTQRMWKAVMGQNPSHFKGETLPVGQVSWDMADRFIKQCNQLLPGINLRLPTEAEWEYACRAGTTTPFHFGHTINTSLVNYNGNFPYSGVIKGEYREKTVEVKGLPCNNWGLYQMHGNIYEWCADWYTDWYGETYYKESLTKDPQGPETGVDRVLRGGSWDSEARNVRSAYRRIGTPVFRYCISGFRLFRGQTSK
jgi:formylglycine-generating enzyme